MRIPGGVKQCLTFVSLTDHLNIHVLFWKLSKYAFIFFFSMSSWRAGTVFRSHYLGQPLRARDLAYRIIVPLIKRVCIRNTHSTTPNPQVIPKQVVRRHTRKLS